MDPAAIERNPQALPSMSPDRPDPVLASDRALRQSTGERDWRPTWRHLVPIVVPVLASQSSRTWRHLCWLSPSASSLMRQAGAGATTVHSAFCHHDPVCRSGHGILATPLPSSQHCTRSPQTIRQTCCRSWSCCSPWTRRHSSLCSACRCSTANRRLPAPRFDGQPQVPVSADLLCLCLS